MGVSKRLFIRPVDSLSDFLVVKNIRNECREFMTNNQKEISFWNQIEFYFKYPFNPDIQLYVGVDERGVRIAYGLVAWKGIHAWLTGGIAEKYRGNGLGFELFKGLEEYAGPRPIFLEVLTNNERAKKLYDSLGYKEFGRRQSENGEVVLMELQ